MSGLLAWIMYTYCETSMAEDIVHMQTVGFEYNRLPMAPCNGSPVRLDLDRLGPPPIYSTLVYAKRI